MAASTAQVPSQMCDFFISRTGTDKDWAAWVAWVLEDAGYTCRLQDWDFRPGRSFVQDMQAGAADCARTIAIMSPGYFKSAFSAREWEAAFAKDPDGLGNALLTVKVRDCEIPGLLKAYPYINLVGLTEEAAREAVLHGVQPGRQKPAIAPSFPGQPVHPEFPGPSPDEGAPALSKSPPSAADIAGVTERVRGLLRPTGSNVGALAVVVAAVPSVALVRPAVLASPATAKALTLAAMSTEPPLLETRDTDHRVTSNMLVIRQTDRMIGLGGEGIMVVHLPATRPRRDFRAMDFGLIEEDFREFVELALGFAVHELISRDDRGQIGHCAVMAQLSGARSLGWRTRSERDANPGTMTFHTLSGAEDVSVQPSPLVSTAAELLTGISAMADDLVALFRQELRPR